MRREANNDGKTSEGDTTDMLESGRSFAKVMIVDIFCKRNDSVLAPSPTVYTRICKPNALSTPTLSETSRSTDR